MDLPKVNGRVGRVWDEHTGGVHHGPSTDDRGVCGDPSDLNRMQAGRAEIRGAVPHCWWWEQQMDLDVSDAIGSDE